MSFESHVKSLEAKRFGCSSRDHEKFSLNFHVKYSINDVKLGIINIFEEHPEHIINNNALRFIGGWKKNGKQITK